MSIEWLTLYARYQQNKSAVLPEQLEKIQLLVRQESPSSIRQCVDLLAASGSEQICRLLSFDGAKVAIALRGKHAVLEETIIEVVSQDEAWRGAYQSGVFDWLE